MHVSNGDLEPVTEQLSPSLQVFSTVSLPPLSHGVFMYKYPAMLAFAAVAAVSSASAQAKPAKDSAKAEKMDHAKMNHGKAEKMDHAKMNHGKADKMDHSRMDHAKADKMDHAKDHAKMEQEKGQARGEHAKADKAHKAKMDHGSDHAISGWKELDDYHMLMMQTWHPIKDKHDVGPARAKARHMVVAAKLLAKSTGPKGCDNPGLRNAAEQLVGETEAVATLVDRKANDDAISARMKTLHDKFEVLEEGCKPAR
jgi:hypothetical protein